MAEDVALQSVIGPPETARGLPNAHYTSSGMYEAEAEALLFANWAAIAFAKDVAPGAAMPIDFVGQPLVVVRNREGGLKVFQNVCRHRGMILVSEKKSVGGVLRCPYHSWCYALTGELVATPHVGGAGQNAHPSISRGELGLVEVRSHVWRDVIFVNVDGQAADFEDYSSDLQSRWQEFGGSAVHPGADSTFFFDVACNWKLAVENYCESYHLPWVHPGLNSYSRLEDHYNIEQTDAYSGQGTLVYRQLVGADGARFADFPGLSEKWDQGAEYVALYPNLLLGVHRDHTFAIILEPLGPARTREHVALYYSSEPNAVAPEFEALRRRNTEMWHTVFKEDLFVVEGMQKGRHAKGFDGGRFSPVMDGPTHCFHRWAAKRLDSSHAGKCRVPDL